VNLFVDEADRLGEGEQEFRANFVDNPGFFYADGPEFRLEYIHDRVEE
jgi:hypothetical protein